MSKNVFAADFETNNDIENNNVWAWGIMNIFDNSSKITYGNEIKTFISTILKYQNKSVIYFHNLKFDGTFIVAELYNEGYSYCFDEQEPKNKTFDTIIDEMNQWYQIRIRNGKKTIFIRDSAKKIPMPISKMPKSFGIDCKKGDLDEDEEQGYNIIREKGHILTEFEKDYLYKDVYILSKALEIMYSQNMDGMTIASDAMKYFKKLITKNDFKKFFPKIPYNLDCDLRKAYRGGWCYCLKNQVVGEGLVFDVNSLYPSVLFSSIQNRDHLYPIGRPLYYKGKYRTDKSHPLFIQHIRCSFVLREGYLPTIQKNKAYNKFGKQEFYTEQYEDIDLYMCNVDLSLFLKHYRILHIEYVDGYKMMGIKGLFDEYINHFIKMKIENNNNPGLRQIAKLYLNSLYGKFGASMIRRSKYPLIKEGMLSYETLKHDGIDFELVDAYRVDVAVFCTAYAREVTINAAQECYKNNRFCYADTDSIHITGLEIPNIHIHPTELGAWKNETIFSKAKFIRAKTYCEYGHEPGKEGDSWNVKCAGMSDKTKKEILQRDDFLEIFDVGFVSDNYEIETKKGELKKVSGKLRPIRTNTGTVLVESTFSIK